VTLPSAPVVTDTHGVNYMVHTLPAMFGDGLDMGDVGDCFFSFFNGLVLLVHLKLLKHLRFIFIFFSLFLQVIKVF
jgi:hypothetical protein